MIKKTKKISPLITFTFDPKLSHLHLALFNCPSVLMYKFCLSHIIITQLFLGKS